MYVVPSVVSVGSVLLHEKEARPVLPDVTAEVVADAVLVAPDADEAVVDEKL